MSWNLNRRSVLCLSAAALSLAVLAQPALAQEEKVSWRMQALWDGGTTPQDFEQMYVDRVAELTGGNFEIELFSAGQIVPPAQAFDAVRGGAFQLMKTFDGYEAGKIPALAFTATIPFGYPEAQQYADWFYERGGLEMAREAYAPAGLQYIAPTFYDQEPIHAKVRIETIADFAGKKGRFVGLASGVMSKFGVAVSPLPTSEVYSALDKGLIDLADRGDLQANLDAGLGEVAEYIIMPGVHQPTTATSYVANKAAYDQLPDNYKEALATAAKDVSAAYQEAKAKSDTTALEAFEKQGVEVITLDEADIKAARLVAAEAWREATKGDELATRILDSQIEQMRELGLIE
ncbi:C4-dicarboxylate ABC transporter substrate-binding protein [Aurantimonas aggregata]|uniref:C4-dicarboxylate ABC transporter substrate-binding protein n=1 Tax=Aurantimonas aggregata TaxID=2047720 RepID=A0A6L9MFT8_9HYPH|nr:TRAP transporter substrate-binding protein DctP [Aurantimonas aggregata]NDV86551.1 C4-dicarboxylate ABC transporter substrate-binding protein [Aurantimonas aggregata]